MVTRVVAAPVDLVWRVFVDPSRRTQWLPRVATVTVLEGAAPAERVRWRETYVPSARRAAGLLTAELQLTVIEPGRRCVLGLAGPAVPLHSYVFAPVEVGVHRGGTVVTVRDDRSAVFADRLFDLVSGGSLARTVEVALRAELDALALVCIAAVAAERGSWHGADSAA